MNTISRLSDWYAAQCNGEWEHLFGIDITTMDNPGWRVRIELSDTPLSDRVLEPIRIQRTETDWVWCRTVDNTFDSSGGPCNLEEILDVFIRWAESVAATSSDS